MSPHSPSSEPPFSTASPSDAASPSQLKCNEMSADGDVSKTTSSKPFHLLDLPAELRNRIYESTLSEMEVEFPQPQPPGLLLVSKQVYTEAISIYYAESVFTSNNELSLFPTQLSNLPPKSRGLINHVVLSLTDWQRASPLITSFEDAIEFENCKKRSLQYTACCVQLALFEFQESLKSCGLPDLASKAEASILLDYNEKAIRTRKPWQTFDDNFNWWSVPHRLYEGISDFFKYKHEGMPLCWARWALGDLPRECCEASVEQISEE